MLHFVFIGAGFVLVFLFGIVIGVYLLDKTILSVVFCK